MAARTVPMLMLQGWEGRREIGVGERRNGRAQAMVVGAIGRCGHRVPRVVVGVGGGRHGGMRGRGPDREREREAGAQHAAA